MATESCLDDEAEALVQRLAAIARETGRSIATAESLTGGQLAAALAAGPDAEGWYRGGIVAYQAEVKRTLLEAPPGPVVNAPTAEAMARSAVELLGADIAVAVTGVGGPEPQEGEPAGTVYLATSARGGEPLVELHRFDGEPIAVMRETVHAALRALIVRATRGDPPPV